VPVGLKRQAFSSLREFALALLPRFHSYCLLLKGNNRAKQNCQLKPGKCKHDLSLPSKDGLTIRTKPKPKMRARQVVGQIRWRPLPLSFTLEQQRNDKQVTNMRWKVSRRRCHAARKIIFAVWENIYSLLSLATNQSLAGRLGITGIIRMGEDSRLLCGRISQCES
jgi:hypothetical protein